MAYEIIIKPSAQKDLDDLPDKEVLHVSKKIENLSVNPRPVGVQKLTDYEGYRIRIGRYGVLFEIDELYHRVNIYRIKHRKEVYC